MSLRATSEGYLASTRELMDLEPRLNACVMLAPSVLSSSSSGM